MEKENDKTTKVPFNKKETKSIDFHELLELIGTSCDYRFCIVDETIDEELIALGAKRDNVEISPQQDRSHNNLVLLYTKRVGQTYYYVEEIRKRNKSLAFKSLWKRQNKNPSE